MILSLVRFSLSLIFVNSGNKQISRIALRLQVVIVQITYCSLPFDSRYIVSHGLAILNSSLTTAIAFWQSRASPVHCNSLVFAKVCRFYGSRDCNDSFMECVEKDNCSLLLVISRLGLSTVERKCTNQYVYQYSWR